MTYRLTMTDECNADPERVERPEMTTIRAERVELVGDTIVTDGTAILARQEPHGLGDVHWARLDREVAAYTHVRIGRSTFLERATWLLIGAIAGMVFATAVFSWAILSSIDLGPAGPPPDSNLATVIGPADLASSRRVTSSAAPLTAAARFPVRGWATVDDGQGRGHAAAGPLLRSALGGDPAFRGERVTVWFGHRHLEVTLTDWCGCGPRHGSPTALDLNPADFQSLVPGTPDARHVLGVLKVRVTRGWTSGIALPPTDTAP